MMAGDYPKNFVFTGWHPNCRCKITPIFITMEEFKQRIEARKAGNLQTWKPNNIITDIPNGLKDYIKNTNQRGAWFEDNAGLIMAQLNNM